MIVQPVRRARQLVLRDRLGEREHLLLDRPFLQYQDEQRDLIVDRNQLHVLEPAARRLRRGYQRRTVRRVCKHRCGQTHPLIDVERHLMELMPDHPLIDRRQLKLLHQRLDKIAIALFRRDASRRGVWMRQVAQILQRRQLVPNGRRADVHPAPPECFRANGLRVLDVFTHHEGEDLFLSLCQISHF